MCFLWPTNLTFKNLDYRINHKPKVCYTYRELRIKCQKAELMCRHQWLMQEIILSFPPSKIIVEYFNIFITISEGLEPNICPKAVLSDTLCRLTQLLQTNHWTVNADHDCILLHV